MLPKTVRRGVSSVSAFMVFERMTADDNNSLKFAPLDNITNMQRTKRGVLVTIGVGEDGFMEKMMDGRLVGGFIFCDTDEFRRVQRVIEAEKGAHPTETSATPQPDRCPTCGQAKARHILDAGKLACPVQDMDESIPISYWHDQTAPTAEKEK